MAHFKLTKYRQDTLLDEKILMMLRHWKAGVGVFAEKFAERDDEPKH